MFRKILFSTAATTIAMAAPTQAKSDDVILSYKLPEVVVGFGVKHMIEKCPDANGDGLEIDVTTQISPTYQAGDTVKINASGNLFVDRSVKLENHPNGTLKSFNGTSSGQGGKLVSAVIGLASFVGAALKDPGVALTGTPDAPPKTLQCRPNIKAAIAELKLAQDDLAKLQDKVPPEGMPDHLQSKIDKTKDRISKLRDFLTITGQKVFWRPEKDGNNWGKVAEAGDLSKWFQDASKEDVNAKLEELQLDGLTKFTLSADFETQPIAAEERKVPGKAVRELIYRLPGPKAQLTMTPAQPKNLSGDMQDLAPYSVFKRYAATNKKASVSVPQMGQIQKVPFNRSGIFGSKAVSATFAEDGSLLTIGYTNTGGADALADVVTTIESSASELRDARLNAIKRKIDVLTQEELLEKELKDEAPSDSSDSSDASDGAGDGLGDATS